MTSIKIGKRHIDVPSGFDVLASTEDLPLPQNKTTLNITSKNVKGSLQIWEGTHLPFTFEPLEMWVSETRGKMTGKCAIIEMSISEKDGVKYRHFIGKRKIPGRGLVYVFSLDIAYEDCLIQTKGWFEETGDSGLREARVLDEKLANGEVSLPLKGWQSDPFDPDLNLDFARNLSEDPKYDAVFPDHPLSICRSFISCAIDGIRTRDFIIPENACIE